MRNLNACLRCGVPRIECNSLFLMELVEDGWSPVMMEHPDTGEPVWVCLAPHPEDLEPGSWGRIPDSEGCVHGEPHREKGLMCVACFSDLSDEDEVGP